MHQALTHEEIERVLEKEPLTAEDIRLVLGSLLARDKEVREFSNRLHGTTLAAMEVSALLLQSLSPLMSTMSPSVLEQLKNTQKTLDDALSLLRTGDVKH